MKTWDDIRAEILRQERELSAHRLAPEYIDMGRAVKAVLAEEWVDYVRRREEEDGVERDETREEATARMMDSACALFGLPVRLVDDDPHALVVFGRLIPPGSRIQDDPDPEWPLEMPRLGVE